MGTDDSPVGATAIVGAEAAGGTAVAVVQEKTRPDVEVLREKMALKAFR